MSAIPKKNDAPRASYTVDAIPEDDERQDELNRRLRKPGEPGYCATETKSVPTDSQNGAPAKKE